MKPCCRLIQNVNGLTCAALAEFCCEFDTLKLELDVVNELIFEVSDSADEISIKMENGYQDYLSTKQKDSALKVSYHSGHHHFEKGPTFTVVLPRQCENWTL